jgi:uncharacterized SAM-binding protein YcdF (DUF218 family)
VQRYHHLCKKNWIFTLAGFLLILLLTIPIRLAIASHFTPEPQAILALGGGPEREKYAAQLAKLYPSLEVWVSSGSNPDTLRTTFQATGISDTRLHLDYRATDTVTNFTTLISDFQEYHIQHIYLITSEYHMPRAKAIATLVLGSQGIIFTPISVPSTGRTESLINILRDCSRAILWIFTGYTGASLKTSLY